MLDKINLLKILLLISFLATITVVWFFVSYTFQNSNSNISIESEIIYVQSSSKSKSSSSQSTSLSTQSSSSSIASSEASSSTLSESSSINSLPYQILDNNISLVKEIVLEIQKPDPEIQSLIKAAKNQPKQEIKTVVEESASSIVESSSKIIE
jgi:hypothetical protein